MAELDDVENLPRVTEGIMIMMVVVAPVKITALDMTMVMTKIVPGLRTAVIVVMTVVVTNVVAVICFMLMTFFMRVAEVSFTVFPVEQEMRAFDAASLLLFDIDGEAGNFELSQFGPKVVDRNTQIDER